MSALTWYYVGRFSVPVLLLSVMGIMRGWERLPPVRRRREAEQAARKAEQDARIREIIRKHFGGPQS